MVMILEIKKKVEASLARISKHEHERKTKAKAIAAQTSVAGKEIVVIDVDDV